MRSAKDPSTRKSRQSIGGTAAGGSALTAKVQLEIQHHFNNAKASLWLDDKLIMDENLRGGDQRNSIAAAG